MASRQSIDSTHSSAPLIENPTPFQPPPPHYPSREAKAKGTINTGTGTGTGMGMGASISNRNDDKARKIKLSSIVVAIRVIALIVTVSVGVSFSVRRSTAPEVIIITILIWLNVVWDALLIVRGLRHPSLQISLVLGDNRVVRFSRPDDEDENEDEDAENGHGLLGGSEQRRRKRECRAPRAFWADVVFVVATAGLNVGVLLNAYSRHRHGIAAVWNWTAISIHLLIVALTASPALSKAYFRFEAVEMPRISLP